MSLERQVVAALKWTASAKFLGQLISWLATLWVIRLLSPADYGIMAMATLVLTIAIGLSELGIGASIVQARSLRSHELASLAGLILCINALGGLLLYLAAPTIAAVFEEQRLVQVLRVCSLQFASNALGTVATSLASRELAFRWLALAGLYSSIASSLVTLLLALNGAGVWSLVWGPIVDGALRSTLLLVGGRWVRPSFDFRGIGRHLKFGGAITFSRMMWTVIYQTDIMIASKVMTSSMVGTYSVALHLATLPMQKIMGIINQVAFPAVARLQDDLPRLHARLLQSVNLMTLVCIPALWGISSVAPEFVIVLLGEKWSAATFPLTVISLIVPFRMISAILWTAVAALGKAGEDLRNTLVNAIVLPVCFGVGSLWGVEGLACAWLVAIPLVMAINLPRLTRAIGIGAFSLLRALWVPALAGVGMWIAVSLFRSAPLELSDPMRLVALSLAGAFVYVGLITLLDRSAWSRFRRFASLARTS